MSTTATAETFTLKLTRFIKAPRERVFASWTNPEDLMRWFGPGASYLVSAKTDVRTGGEYSLVMKTTGCGGNAEDGLAEISGIYKEVNKPSRLVFTWGWSNNPRDNGDATTVTIDLAEVQGGTQVTLTHEGFSTEEARDNHGIGWNGAIDKLERNADKMACMGTGMVGWNELITPDTGVSKAYYTELFGWHSTDMPMPADIGTYTIFKQGGSDVGGMLQCQQPGVPAQWLPYFMVEDIEASTAKSAKLGGNVVVSVKDIGIGRLSVVIDPKGASFGLFQPTM